MKSYILIISFLALLVPLNHLSAQSSCDSTSLQTFSGCIDSCSTATPACASSGIESEYVDLLTNSLADCSYPSATNRSDLNELKKIIDGFRGMGVLTKSAARSLNRAVNNCRKQLGSGGSKSSRSSKSKSSKGSNSSSNDESSSDSSSSASSQSSSGSNSSSDDSSSGS